MKFHYQGATEKTIIKKVLKILIIIVAILVLIIVSPLILIAGCSLLTPNPPKPEITYEEFPFELVYEINGEKITVNDTYVCEFDGFGSNEGVGKYRKWKGYVKSTGEEYVILIQDGDLKLCCSIGSASYYMGDSDYETNSPNIFYTKPNDMGGFTIGGMPEELEALKEQYKIQIISWDLSDPIENSFK